jgi:hypothetical protein
MNRNNRIVLSFFKIIQILKFWYMMKSLISYEIFESYEIYKIYKMFMKFWNFLKILNFKKFFFLILYLKIFFFGKFWNFIWNLKKKIKFCKILKFWNFWKFWPFFAIWLADWKWNLVSGWTTLKHRIDNRQK